MMAFIISFESTTAAMRWLSIAEAEGIPGRVIPVPRALASGCGLAWMAPLEAKPAVLQIIEGRKIEVGKMTEMEYKSRWTREERSGTGEGKPL